jgi:hypothetical protein
MADQATKGMLGIDNLGPLLTHFRERCSCSQQATMCFVACEASELAVNVEMAQHQIRTAMAELETARRDVGLLEHKLTTCGVAASHPDPMLSRCVASWGGPFDSPQAEDVRKLRDDRDALRRAAQAVVDRWDTPLWKDAPATGVSINALREALAGANPAAATYTSQVEQS